MNPTSEQKRICEQVLNAFETGSAQGDYSNISIFNDGPNNARQVTYGRSQTTEYGNLKELVRLYVENPAAQFGEALRPYLPRIGQQPLVDDAAFKDLLKKAGKSDPVMRQTQDEFFDKRYFQPAIKWAADNGFSLALSALVIYDSFIHSGRIRDEIRNMFPERPPANGGDEKAWTTAYVKARHSWLANHPRTALHNTVYRTKCLANEITRSNWDLSQRPINANGVMIH